MATNKPTPPPPRNPEDWGPDRTTSPPPPPANGLSLYQAMQKSLGELEVERNTLARENAFLRSIVEESIATGKISPDVLLIGRKTNN